MSVAAAAPSGMTDVQARIAAIQARIGTLAAGGNVAKPLSGSLGLTASAATGSFSDSLASALGSSDPSSDGSEGSDGVLGLGSSSALGVGALGSTAGVSGTASATGAGSTGSVAVSLAKDYLGIPYLWGGTDPAKGLDCSGLTKLVYGKLGVTLPRVSADQSKVGEKIPSLAQAQPGDLLFFHSPVTHVAIYAGGGKMVEAPHTGAKVRVSDVWATPSVIRRVLPSGPSATAATGAAGALTGTPYSALFQSEGARAGVSPALLAAVAKTESGFRSDATSPAGAVGLMQLMPSTAAGLGVDPSDPRQAVRGAATLLAGYLKDYSGDVDTALAAYNAGPAAVRSYGGVPPYGETKAYVARVRAAMQEVST
ncbi:cell wall-associated NlpC family hydrolase [Motilibacter peucedani]|uniref:Cell wall-associated NlpC family hydrolase n=1 Tax=Motilibacter peucedani TaxID=598650 RepID=A0A420XTQ0_9ACTN|nr:transglycosylase SLT domain-containing protein [Motilibacter peucedani]RKS80130.1 cell wall-associated NlpC family hydrolase [Motilibacter peucedani]